MANQGKIEVLADWLEKQVSDSSILDKTIWNSMGLSKGTFYRMKPTAVDLMNKRVKDRQKLVEQAKGKAAVEMVAKGVKTRIERILILQEQVDACLEDLARKSTKGIMMKVTLRKAIKDIQSEISKIEGDYEKDNGQKQPIVVNQPFSDTQVDKILQTLKSKKK